MANEITEITSWAFTDEAPIPDDIGPLLVEGERAVVAYKTFRDSAVFTDRRLIVRDAQGIRGKKIEVYSLPYSSIFMWSSENAGMLDLTTELELWTRIGRIKIKLARTIDPQRLDRLISDAVLGSL